VKGLFKATLVLEINPVSVLIDQEQCSCDELSGSIIAVPPSLSDIIGAFPNTAASSLTVVVGEKADDVFISWLKSNRESGLSVTLAKVKEKVAQLFNSFGISTIEKTCKWFLLWNNR
jgi:hypothetical protein